MRIVVSGSRYITDVEAVARILRRELILPGREVTVIHGAHRRGVDKIADAFAISANLPIERHPVSPLEWKRLGLKAGPMRNRRMLERADKLVAIWDGKSPGTKSAIDIARQLKVEHHVYFLEAP